jgi:recombination protein RecA
VGREYLAKSLTKYQEEILIGSLLGDARLECRSTAGSARLRFHHADSQKAYLFWKSEIFKEYAGREPWKYEWFDERTKKMYQAWFFHTKTSQVFHGLHKMFYPNKKKILPRNLGYLLTPLVIAIWYMDDGCRSDEMMIFNSQSFSLEEQKYLVSVMKDKFNINLSIQKDRRNFRLIANKAESAKLSKIIQPYIIESMKCKILPVTTDPNNPVS